MTTLAASCSCDEPHDSTSHGRAAASTHHADSEEYAGGIAWHADSPLVQHATSGPMRAAEYAVTGHPEATLAVFHFGPGEGGSVDDNINRWVDQFTQADGRSSRDVATITRGDAGGMPVTFVDVTGSFSGMRGTEASVTAQDQRMLGAIVEGPEGLVFFKLMGPADVIDTAAEAFRQMMDSVHPTN